MAWPKPTRSSAARGYGAKHRKLRRQWELRVAAGGVNCWRCQQPIYPWMQWHLGHDDWDRTIVRGPEHQRCNIEAGARMAKLARRYGKTRVKPVHRW